MKKHRPQRSAGSLYRQERQQAALDLADEIDDGRWTKHTRWHWSRDLGTHETGVQNHLQYWPTSDKYQITDADGEDHVRAGAMAFLRRLLGAETTPVQRCYPHPGYHGRPYPISTVLRDLASQEACDGEPYDVMVAAAEEIDRLYKIMEAYQWTK